MLSPSLRIDLFPGIFWCFLRIMGAWPFKILKMSILDARGTTYRPWTERDKVTPSEMSTNPGNMQPLIGKPAWSEGLSVANLKHLHTSPIEVRPSDCDTTHGPFVYDDIHTLHRSKCDRAILTPPIDPLFLTTVTHFTDRSATERF